MLIYVHTNTLAIIENEKVALYSGIDIYSINFTINHLKLNYRHPLITLI